MLHTWTLTIPQLEPAGLERRAYLYLPAAYDEEPDRRFPVLYMLDGQNVFLDSEASFGRSWRMYDYLNWSEAPVIVVAVASNPIGNNRLCEYSPFTHEEPGLGEIEGRGRVMMDWMVRVLKPQIDRHFRTLPGREDTAIAGSSMGGLLSLYAACCYSGVFSRIACLSPSVWVDPGRVRKMLRRARIKPDTTVYLDYGADEIDNHEDTAGVLPSVFQSLYAQGVNLTFRIIPHGVHSEACWEEQVPVFMQCLGLI
ncbi:MAG: alpha/beta hydrolase [Clostridia bacterium]|nr:alpha/beta hydrolase [Clostridia bacterium]